MYNVKLYLKNGNLLMSFEGYEPYDVLAHYFGGIRNPEVGICELWTEVNGKMTLAKRKEK